MRLETTPKADPALDMPKQHFPQSPRTVRGHTAPEYCLWFGLPVWFGSTSARSGIWIYDRFATLRILIASVAVHQPLSPSECTTPPNPHIISKASPVWQVGLTFSREIFALQLHLLQMRLVTTSLENPPCAGLFCFVRIPDGQLLTFRKCEMREICASEGSIY